ncbi:hypothetical protein RAH32_21060 [Paracoccus sp. WLY502]|uniref:hypothetical protein n=1 Tax=Paracoccus yibinensis TaxID=3068891 RepID=UPI0027968CA2|nr:hypothetical protein [Paracoccus sp. WLY502]MDQ1902905.1 hypothetical protein [Paracoccus sp. WLY502]
MSDYGECNKMLLFLILVLSFSFAVLMKRYLIPGASEALVAAVAFLPALLFFFQTGSVAKLSGFGVSVERLQQQLETGIAEVGVAIADLEAGWLSPVDPDGPSFGQAAYWESCSRFLVLRKSDVPAFNTPDFSKYVRDATWAIRSSLTCGKLQGVIVLDETDRYIGSYNSSFFSEALAAWALPDIGASNPDLSNLADRIMMYSTFGTALRFPERRIELGDGYVAAVNENQTVEQALTDFKVPEVKFVAVTDARGVLKGVLTFEDLNYFLLQALVSSSGS